MNLALGNLPDGTKESEIRSLLKPFSKVTDIVFLKNKPGCHSCYECLVTMDIDDPVIGFIIADQLNHYCWKGSQIESHRLLF